MSLILLLFAPSLFCRDVPLLMQHIIRKGHINDGGGRHVLSIIFNLSSMVPSDELEDSHSDFSKQAANKIFEEMHRQHFNGEGID
jgi:hypothetical protein